MYITKGKVIFVGDLGVGKTSILYKYINETGPVSATVAGTAIPVDVKLSNNQTVKLNVWDTSGSEDYRVIVPMYSRSAQVAIITFSVVKEETFENIDNWIQCINKDNSIPYIYLVGNKVDLTDTFQDYIEKAEIYADKKKVKLYFTSALTGQNINLLFEDIANIVDQSKCEPEKPTIKFTDEANESSSCC